MKKTLQNIIVFCFVNLLFFSNTFSSFAKPVFESLPSSQTSLKKENTLLSKVFFINSFAEDGEEEKNQDDFSKSEFDPFQFQHSIHQTSSFQIIYSQISFDFLKIKVELFRHLFLLFHSLKIACC